MEALSAGFRECGTDSAQGGGDSPALARFYKMETVGLSQNGGVVAGVREQATYTAEDAGECCPFASSSVMALMVSVNRKAPSSHRMETAFLPVLRAAFCTHTGDPDSMRRP